METQYIGDKTDYYVAQQKSDNLNIEMWFKNEESAKKQIKHWESVIAEYPEFHSDVTLDMHIRIMQDIGLEGVHIGSDTPNTW